MAPFSLFIMMGPKQLIYINHILLEVGVSQKALLSICTGAYNIIYILINVITKKYFL
jgi:hypothetical protein